MLPLEPVVDERIPLDGSAPDHEQDYCLEKSYRLAGRVLSHGKLGAKIDVKVVDHHLVELSGSDVLSSSVFHKEVRKVFSGHEVFLVRGPCLPLSDLRLKILKELILIPLSFSGL